MKDPVLRIYDRGQTGVRPHPYDVLPSVGPVNRRRPDGSTTGRMLARCDPSLARLPSTATTSPMLREFLVHPRRTRLFGLPICRPQFVVRPCASATSMNT